MPGKYILSDAEFRATSLVQSYEPGGKYFRKWFSLPYESLDHNNAKERALDSAMETETENVNLGMVGKSPDFKEMTGRLRKIMYGNEGTPRDDIPFVVLVTGETGTGKDMVAKALYLGGPRKRKPFATLDFGIIMQNPNLFRSEVYGTRKGAFTDAVRQVGILERAKGGVIHADEIGALIGNEIFQHALLGLMDGKAVYAMGEGMPAEVDVRIVASTNANLGRAVNDGGLRGDLYERLSQFSVHVPPLRERKEDIPLLVDFYLRTFNEVYKIDPHFSFNPSDMDKLAGYPWSRNIRQLKHTIMKSVLEGGLVMPESDETRDRAAADTIESAAQRIVQSGLVGSWNEVRIANAALEKAFLNAFVAGRDWNLRRFAGELGIDRKTLAERFYRYGIEGPGR